MSEESEPLAYMIDLKAEAAVLSLVMVLPEMIKRIDPILRSEFFYSAAHQAIYAACIDLYRKGIAADVVTVAGHLRDNGRLLEAGGMAYITEILNAAPGTGNAVFYAKAVANKYNVRNLVAACKRIAAEGESAHGEDAEFISKAGNRIREISRTVDRSALTSNKEALRQVFLQIQAASSRGSDISGLTTGIESYDRLNTGLHGGRLYIVGARPAGGKTARLIQMATHIAMQGFACAFFSLEMQKSELCMRQVSMLAKVDSANLAIGRLSADEWRRVTTVIGEISNLAIKIDDNPDLTINQIRERALGAIEEGLQEKKPIAAVFVDYLQRMRVPKEDFRMARHEQVGRMAEGCKELAKSCGIPVIAAVQLKRIPEGRPGRRPTLDDAREAGQIESEADECCFLYRSSQYDKSADPRTAEFVIVKNRHGGDGIIEVGWEPEYTLFTNKKPTY